MRLKKIRDRHNSDVKNVHFLMIIESGGIEKKKEDERRTAAKIKWRKIEIEEFNPEGKGNG